MAYIRQPKKALAKCLVPGCRWKRIFFADDRKKWPPEVRAEISRGMHLHHAHQKGVANAR